MKKMSNNLLSFDVVQASAKIPLTGYKPSARTANGTSSSVHPAVLSASITSQKNKAVNVKRFLNLVKRTFPLKN